MANPKKKPQVAQGIPGIGDLDQMQAMLAAQGAAPMGQNPLAPNVNPQPAFNFPQAPQMDFGKIIAALNAPRGRHLGIGGAELTPDNPQGNFGGDPFTNGFFNPHPQSDYRPGAAYHPPNMPQASPFMPGQGDMAPTPGSPVYRQQNPGFNMFADQNFPQQNSQQNPQMPPVNPFAFGAGQNSGQKKPFSFGMLPRR